MWVSKLALNVDDRRHLQFFLRWRWWMLVIALPVTLAIEILEARSLDLRFVAEVLVDGLVAPLSIWLLFTFAAQNIGRRLEREEALEQRQLFMQRLAEHRDYADLTHFLVSFPSTLLPVDHASLYLYDHRRARLNFVTEWNSASGGGSAAPCYLATPTICPACLSSKSSRQHHTGACAFAPDQPRRAAALEQLIPLSHDGLVVGALRLRCRAGQAPAPGQIEFLSALASAMALALVLAIAISRQVDQVYREAQIHERRRITHEVHDSLAQQVFYLHLGLDQLAGDEALQPLPGLQGRVEALRAVAADVYEQVRHNLAILRVWEKIDLTEALIQLTRLTAQRAGLTIQIDVQGEAARLSPHMCERIYGMAREALNNVVRHARARQVRLNLAWSADAFSLWLADDGVGFDPTHLPGEGHYGLALIREALEALHGRLTLESGLGQGTRLQLNLPLRPSEPYPRHWGAGPQVTQALATHP